ncbi:MAG TPA: pyruvate synthase [candidate division WOR-3 bacterium]|uniref:Pyruvate synthase n=1 Tax=candidate division WOR-3 bacterium TaxID=2052148 RepID=A0A7V5LT78_UNCW3|nr:pyruvate synthase [candidate division WOR-3 bacterium]
MVKSKEMLEIRWHGRGGMGAKTAALLLGEAMLHQGKYIQAFPEYGPERRGAPVTSYNRISDNPIRIHYGIKEPDAVVVLDPTLLPTERVREGLNEDTILLVNSKMQPEEIRKKFNINAKVYTVDATGISEEILGRNLPNTPMLGALVRVTGLIDFDTFLKAVEERLKVKYKENIVKGNLEAIKKAFEEVKGL